MTCKDCIHNEVCHMREVCNDIEQQIKELGCMDFIARADVQEIKHCEGYKIKCEKCGPELEKLNVLTFARDGSDYEDKCEAGVCGDEAVVVETSQDWCGYELTEEEMLDTITCPHCGKFPFESTELYVYDIVQVVMFRKDGKNETD